MRINDHILHALRQAVETAGGAKELAARSQVSASNISRYLSGKVRSITDDCWEKLLPFLEFSAPPAAAGTICNTPELRDFIIAAMEKCGIKAYPCASLRDAVERASHESQPKRGRPDILICGSLFLAGEALTILSPDFKHDSIDPSEKFRKDY
jgi:hypothetical protein